MPSPSESARRPPAATDVTRPRRPPGRFVRWVRRPASAVALLGIAVAVSVAQGQPPPAARDSGVSVPAQKPYPRSVGILLVVVDGGLVRLDTADNSISTVPLPRGLTALRAWNQEGRDVVLGRLAGDRTAAYLLTRDAPVALGPAEAVVPSADRTAVWLVSRRIATRVPLAGGPRRSVPLPRASRLVGDTPSGLVVSTGTVPDPVLPGRRATETPAPTPTLTAAGTAGVPSPTPPAGIGTAPTGTGPSGSPSPSPSPTTPAYTTASPVPSTGAGGIPLTTLVVAADGSVRYLAPAEALAAVGDVVLLRDDQRRLGVISPRPGLRTPRLLPKLNAVEAIGPGTLDARGETFAVLGRTNDYAWLMVGPTGTRTAAGINVVALDGGAPLPGSAPPAFTASGRVLTIRPDGRIVYYAPGERDGFLLGDELPAASAVSQA